MLKFFPLALKLVLRDWRSGELTTLATALFIAVAATTAIGMMGDRLSRTMILQSAEFIGADLAVSTHTEPPASWYAEAARLGLTGLQTTEFSSVLVENGDILLVGVKAVPPGYPLRGAPITTDSMGGAATETHDIPQQGEVWAEPQVLRALNLKTGNTIAVGEKSLRITRLILQEQDKRGELFSLSPRVMMNRADLEATRVIQPGSHVHHYALFAGASDALDNFKRWLKPQLEPSQKITDINEDRPELGRAIQRAEHYLGLASIAVVLIAGVAIAMSARRYTERHYDLSAILKCLGASQRDVLTIACLQLLIASTVVITLAVLAGWGLQAGVIELVRELLPHTLEPPGLVSWLIGGATGLLILVGFALPPVLRLRGLSPLRVLRRELEPLTSSAILVYGLASLTILLLMWRYTEDWKTTLTILGITGLAVVLFGLTGRSLLILSRLLIPHVPLSARLGLQHLTRRPVLGITQILAFSTTLVAMQVILLVRTELIEQWKHQIPADAPNFFALNLFDADLEPFRQFLRENRIHGSEIYPIVRGRLVSVNGEAVLDRVKAGSQAEGAINRELSLTWTANLPEGNRVTAGHWPEPNPGGLPSESSVSIEEKLAGQLGVKPGDLILFNIAGQALEARVGSLRSLHWDSMTPNFYMIFPPGALDRFPHSWLTSLNITPEHSVLATQLMKAFPGVTLLDVSKLLGQFQAILAHISLAMEFVLVLALAAGFTVLVATVHSTMDERTHEVTLLRTMGASSLLLKIALWVEFACLGFASGLLAAMVSESIVWVIYRRILDIGYEAHPLMWVILPTLSAITIGVAGYLSVRRITLISPMVVLREL